MSVRNEIIRDQASGAIAEIAPELGFNCHRFAAKHDGRLVEVLWSDAGFLQGTTKPSRSGVPILFPFPGRIPGPALEWEGKRYELGTDDGRGNAIHGFVHTRPWKVLERTDSRLVGQFHAWRDDASLKERWPADFCITASY